MYKDLLLTDYFTEVYADVESILDEEKPDTKGEALDALDKNIDRITGEITGSYDCNTEIAKEKVLNELGMFLDAVNWFDVSSAEVGEWFLNEYWETMDVLVRRYVYDYAINDMLEMYAEKDDD